MADFRGFSIEQDPSCPEELLLIGPVPRLSDGAINWAKVAKDGEQAMIYGSDMPYMIVKCPS